MNTTDQQPGISLVALLLCYRSATNMTVVPRQDPNRGYLTAKVGRLAFIRLIGSLSLGV